ncbi:hypothetical protein [Cystobacter ferrugineus]|uniref:Uncharacterized protein n=1 Tax=Cystobacter ferrugineus TaxID=83449 RepID=A0A1L9B188_9BACT|nr:hypothetical protein [Cystobacter ferrugineus]OJH36024.1 hypothetical protein BON30_36100 [Cystobacter ferrugineus]
MGRALVLALMGARLGCGAHDSDGDGATEGEPSLHCTGPSLPPELTEMVTDCAPGDPTRYTPWNDLGRDEDGDGV